MALGNKFKRGFVIVVVVVVVVVVGLTNNSAKTIFY
jgi:Tfp pilus assembly protein PilX